MNGDSSGKPNSIPLKANSRRSEATLTGRLCRKVFGFVNEHPKGRGVSVAKRRSFGEDLGCRGKGQPAPLPVLSYVEAQLILDSQA